MIPKPPNASEPGGSIGVHNQALPPIRFLGHGGQMGLADFLIGVVFAAALAIGLTMGSSGHDAVEFWVARLCFVAAAAAAVGAYAHWMREAERKRWASIAFGVLVFAVACVGTPGMILWVNAREAETLHPAPPVATAAANPANVKPDLTAESALPLVSKPSDRAKRSYAEKIGNRVSAPIPPQPEAAVSSSPPTAPVNKIAESPADLLLKCVNARNTKINEIDALIREGRAAQIAFEIGNHSSVTAIEFSTWVAEVQDYLDSHPDLAWTGNSAKQFKETLGNQWIKAPEHQESAGTAVWQEIEAKKAFLSELIAQLKDVRCDYETHDETAGK